MILPASSFLEKDGHVHQRRAADPARRRRRSTRPAARKTDFEILTTRLARARPRDGLRDAGGRDGRDRRADARTSPASRYERLGRSGPAVAGRRPTAPTRRSSTRSEFDPPGGRGALRRAALQGARRRRPTSEFPLILVTGRRLAALQRRHDDPPHRQPRAARPRLARDPPRRRRRGCGSPTATSSRSAAASGGSRSTAQRHRADRARPRLHRRSTSPRCARTC